MAKACFRERDEAKRELADYLQSQTPSPFFIEKYEVGGSHKHYIQTQKMTVQHAGVELEINLMANNMRDGDGIELSYGRPDGPFVHDGIAIVPRHHNCIELRTPENMIDKRLLKPTKNERASKDAPKGEK